MEAIERALDGVGGTLESLYFAFGPDDVYVIVDVPDNVAATAMAATVASSGAIDSYETVVLQTPDEMDRAMSVAVVTSCGTTCSRRPGSSAPTRTAGSTSSAQRRTTTTGSG